MTFKKITYLTAGGLGGSYYLYLLETARRPSQGARLELPFMNATGKCLTLFFEVFGDQPAQLKITTTDVSNGMP